MGLLAKAFSLVSGGVVGALIDPFLKLAQMYFNKEITKAELQQKTEGLLLDTVAKVEVANADALARTFGSYMDAVKSNPWVARCYVLTLTSQLFVLCWYQWIVPFGTFAGWWTRYPSPGGTIEWAYLLVGGLCGLAPAMFRGGEGGGGWLGRLRGMVWGGR